MATIAEAMAQAIHLHQAGQLAQAEQLYRQVLQVDPAHAPALHFLGIMAHQLGQQPEALEYLRQAVELAPREASFHNNLGLVYHSLGQFDEASASYREAMCLRPDYPEAHNNLGNTLKDQGQLDEAIACFRRALAAKPQDAVIHSNLLYALLYHPDYAPETIFQEHLAWAERHGVTTAPVCPRRPAPREPGRRLRIGYVSPDFREHVMGRYIEAVIGAHDRDSFEVFCYSDVLHPDALTGRVQVSAEHWRSLVGLPHDQVADLILKDAVDILVDLAGHTAGNRLAVFARKPAPLQLSHFGYYGTTGLAAVDYRLTDLHTDPPGRTERYHTEKLVRIPEIMWCYPTPQSPAVSALPAVPAGHVTLGCFNNLCKLTEEMVRLWSQILKALPHSRMLLLSGGGRAGDERVREAFARREIDSARITLLGRRSRYDYFKLHHEIDLGLDTYPFTGCNTTADALWMGVPVVSLAGPTCVTRQGLAALIHVGLGDLVQETPADYVEAAIRLGRDLPRLSELRAGLRDRMQRSPLLNVARFTQHLEETYGALWQRESRP